MPSLIGTLVGNHRVTRLLGAGGLGSVFLAEHPVIGTRVAIKILRPDVAADAGMIDRFILEARAASQLDSPHIPRYLDFGQLPGGEPFAVMEYLEGETLGARLRRDGPLSVADTVTILTQVATTIADAHARGIIHRDLKPENLFLVATADGSDVVKVLDFGIAKLMSDHPDPSATAIGLVVGTPYYCAPEQALGLAVGPATDVYALGATAFEMLTGRPPFVGDVTEILTAKATSDAPPARTIRADLPATVERGLAAMLARDPEHRPASMSAVVAELLAWVAHASEPLLDQLPTFADIARPYSPPPEPPRAAPRRWPIAAASFVAITAIAVVVHVAWSSDDGGRASAHAEPRAVTPIAIDAGASAQVPDASNPEQARARALYAEGSRFYNLREYRAAIAAFRAAYAAYPEPTFLFDLAQASRQLHDCDGALAFYRAYLRENPATEDRAATEQLVAEMATCVAKRQHAAPPTRAAPTVAAAPVAAAPPAPRAPPPDAGAPAAPAPAAHDDGVIVDPFAGDQGARGTAR